MFDFLLDAFNYKERLVARYNGVDLCVDTAAVSDGQKPYETGIKHANYRNGAWIIVECYDTKEEARTGHDKWVELMRQDVLPKSLTDCRNALLCKFMGSAVYVEEVK